MDNPTFETLPPHLNDDAAMFGNWLFGFENGNPAPPLDPLDPALFPPEGPFTGETQDLLGVVDFGAMTEGSVGSGPGSVAASVSLDHISILT